MRDGHSSWLTSTVFDLIDTRLKNFVFMLCEQPNERLCTVPMNGAVLCNVVGHGRQAVLVKIDQFVQTSLSYVKC